MKIAISISDDLFEEIEEVAKDSKCSRSKIYAIALKEHLEKIKSHKLLKDLNVAYSTHELQSEKRLREKSKKYYVRKIARKERGH